ncbi:MAG: tetratricopeptide repeat protein [Polyangiaceae bacterium]
MELTSKSPLFWLPLVAFLGLGGWVLLRDDSPDLPGPQLLASAAAGAANLPEEPSAELEEPTPTEPPDSGPPAPSASSEPTAKIPEAIAQAAAAEALRTDDNWEAKAQSQVCLRLNPRNLECSRTLRMACGRMGDFVCERAEVDDCLERDPKDYECLVARAKLNTIKRRFKDAESDLAELRKQQPNGMWTILTEAVIHEAKGDLPKALDGYRKACDEGQESACLAANRLDTKLHKKPPLTAPAPSASHPKP